MRLRTLDISDFRKFDKPVRIEGLGDGVNVLAAPNEHGKSTLLAAIKAVLFERHAAKTKAAQRMQHHRNATSPVIGMGFELPTGLHRIEKRFMHREPYARLLLPDGTRLEGDAAEERLQSLLGFAPAGKLGATDDTRGIWGALWVEQCRAVEQPGLPETSRGTLHECLEAELGSLRGDDRGSALRREVRTALSVLLDGNGKPKGRFKEAIEEEAGIGVELAGLRLKRDALASDIDALGRLRRTLASVNDADEADRLATDLSEARSRRDAVLLHRELLATAMAERELARDRLADVETEVSARATRANAIGAAGKLVEAAEAAETQAIDDLRDADTALGKQQAAVADAETRATEAAKRSRSVAAVLAVVARSGQLGAMERRLARASAARDEELGLIGEVAAVPANEATLREVRTATTGLARARSVLDALATEVEVELEEGIADRVTASGTVLPIGRTVLRAISDTVIDIAGVGRVRIRPAIRDRVKLETQISSAEVVLETALAAAGAVDLDDAEAKAAARGALEGRLRDARAVLAAETAGDEAAGLEAGLDALDDHVAALRGIVSAEISRLGLEILPEAAEAQAELAAAVEADEGAADALTTARAALAGPEAARRRSITVRAEAAAGAAAARDDLARLELEAGKALTQEDDASLAERRVRLVAASEQAAAAVTKVEESRPSESLEGMDARIARLEKAGANRITIIRDLKQDIAVTASRVAHDEGEGIDEQIASFVALGEMLRREGESLQHEADVLTLLRDTLEEAERGARKRYVEPVVRRITPYLQRLFPEVEVACGDQLQVTGMTRGQGHEEIDRLSEGTREQVAVLLRLAYADLLAEQGKPAMLILDDALAYSDHERLEQMFDVLTQAADRIQILVLTCRSSAFGRLGGNRVRLVTGRPVDQWSS